MDLNKLSNQMEQHGEVPNLENKIFVSNLDVSIGNTERWVGG